MKLYNCLLCGKENRFGHSKTNKFCGSTCLWKYEHEEFIKRWKAGLEEGVRGSTQTSSRIRKYIVEKFNNTCQSCGQEAIHNGKPLSMQLEHIDGNSRNNKEENLSLLCPNCHTQTEFYGSKNKGRGRGSLLKNLSG